MSTRDYQGPPVDTHLYTHKEDGGRYKLVHFRMTPKVKDEHTGSWHDAVAYEDVRPESPFYAQVYFCSAVRWREKFEVVG